MLIICPKYSQISRIFLEYFYYFVAPQLPFCIGVIYFIQNDFLGEFLILSLAQNGVNIVLKKKIDQGSNDWKNDIKSYISWNG